MTCLKKILGIMRHSGMATLFLLLIVAAVLLFAQSGMNNIRSMTQLEMRISQTLSHTAGAGKVSVVIRTAKQTQQNQTITGYGTVEDVPCGAVAVAQGGDDPLVRLRLTNALCALLGLQASQIDVVGMSEGNVGL